MAVDVPLSKTGSLAQAMALRVKYRIGDGKESSRCCSVELLGPHPYNRGGAYPSGNRIHLFAHLFTVAGYSTIAQGLFVLSVRDYLMDSAVLTHGMILCSHKQHPWGELVK